VGSRFLAYERPVSREQPSGAASEHAPRGSIEGRTPPPSRIDRDDRGSVRDDLAAGSGEGCVRFPNARPPKPLLIVGGKAIIVWQIEALVRACCTEIVVNV